MSDKNRGLFEIHAIHKDTDEVVFHQKVVAEGEKESLWESNLKDELKKKNISREEVHLLVKEIGTLPAKEDVKKVKIVGSIGKYEVVKNE